MQPAQRREFFPIGHHLVSDTYIAPFSRSLARGAYEGHSVLDFVAENRPLLRPSTVRSDTLSVAVPAGAAVGSVQRPRTMAGGTARVYDWRIAPNPRRLHIYLAEREIEVELVEVGQPDMTLAP